MPRFAIIIALIVSSFADANESRDTTDAKFVKCKTECDLSDTKDKNVKLECKRDCDRKFPQTPIDCPELVKPCQEKCKETFLAKGTSVNQISEKEKSHYFECFGNCTMTHGGDGCTLLRPYDGPGSSSDDVSKGRALGEGKVAPIGNSQTSGETPTASHTSANTYARDPTTTALIQSAASTSAQPSKALPSIEAESSFAGLSEKRKQAEKLETQKSSTPVEEFIRNAALNGIELTIFEQVSRVYREKRSSMQR